MFSQMVGTSDILDRLEKSGTRINLVLLDACRDNPFRDRGVRSNNGGLAQMPAPIGTLISFATQPRSVSLDGDDGHSPYTRALVAAMQRPGAGLFKTFNEVGLAVRKGHRRPATAVGVVVADLGQFLFRRQARARTREPSRRSPGTSAPLQIGSFLASRRSAAAEHRHRLRPAGGDARRHRTPADITRSRRQEDERRSSHDRLQRRDAEISRRGAVRVRGGAGRDRAQGLSQRRGVSTIRPPLRAMPWR